MRDLHVHVCEIIISSPGSMITHGIWDFSIRVPWETADPDKLKNEASDYGLHCFLKKSF